MTGSVDRTDVGWRVEEGEEKGVDEDVDENDATSFQPAETASIGKRCPIKHVGEEVVAAKSIVGVVVETREWGDGIGR